MTQNTFFLREAVITYKPARARRLEQFSGSHDVVSFLRGLLGNKLVEHFVAIALSSRQKPVAWSIVSIGSMTHCPVALADVLRFSVIACQPALVVAHNHPSGDPTPSAEDIRLTERIGDGAALLGIKLVDHVIVGDDAHFSFVDAGMPLGSSASR